MEKSIVFLLGSMLVAAPLAEGWRAVSNGVAKYRVSIPEAWHVWKVEPNGALGASSYLSSQALEGGLVPAGQAAIYIVPAWNEVKDPASWAKTDLQGVRKVNEKNVVIGAPDVKGVQQYLELEWRDEVGPGVYYRTIGAYFYFQEHLLRATLEFKEGDPREGSYRTILEKVLRSISPILRKQAAR